MSSLARSCLRVLLLYVVCAVAVGVVVHHRVPILTIAIWSGVIAGFFLFLAIAYLFAIPIAFVDWWRMRPGAKPRDGKRVAIVGPIRNAGASLHSPFTRQSCVAYHYKIISMEGEQPKNDYEGFALVPSYIATEDGQIRILAYPELEFPWEKLRGEEPRDHARAYIAATTFTNVRQKGVKGAMAELSALMSDDDGTIRYDHRIEPVTDDLGKCMLEERVLLSGENVCALGKYSEERRAIVPDPGAFSHSLTIKKGTPESFRRGQIKKAIGSAFGVVFLLALLAVAAGIFLSQTPLDAAEQDNPDRRFFWEEVQLEHWLERNFRKRPETGPMYFLDLCRHCAKGRLEAGGKNIELKYAAGWEDAQRREVFVTAAEGEKDGVKLTYDKEKRIKHVLVVINGTEFTVPDDWLLPSDVHTSLHDNETLDGRLTVMAPNGSVRMRAAFRAPLEQR